MKQVCSVIVSFLLSLSLDALKSPCPWEAGVKRPKATWEREMGHVFICARAPPGWNPVFSGRCVHARTVVCNIRIFFFFSPLLGCQRCSGISDTWRTAAHQFA